MGYVVFQQLPDTPLDEADVRSLALLLRNQNELAARSVAFKIDKALTDAEDSRASIELEHHELVAVRLALREEALESDRPSLTQFRLALEQLLA
jgi:hypothetical protein